MPEAERTAALLTDLPKKGFGPIRPPAGDRSPSLRRQVFESVRSHGEISRLSVAKHLGVSPASVTIAATDLLALGLLKEGAIATQSTGRGRPPVALTVDERAGLVAGIKLSDPVSTAVLTDFVGRPLASASQTAHARVRSVDGILSEAGALFDQLLANAGVSASEVLAIGLGLPGTVDFNAGDVLWSPIIAEQSVPLRDLATQHFGCPVEIDNDANLATLAELWFGGGRQRSDFAVITIEHGVGMGLVIDHQLYRGANRVGLELGHTTVQLDGAICRCGKRGCLEAYVADYALAREAATVLGGQAANSGSHRDLLEHLHNRAKQGDEAARAVFQRAGRYLALGIANVISLYDPSSVVLSGERLEFDFLYADDVMAEIGKKGIFAGRTPKIDVNALGDLVWARGAAALALDQLTARLTGEIK